MVHESGASANDAASVASAAPTSKQQSKTAARRAKQEANNNINDNANSNSSSSSSTAGDIKLADVAPRGADKPGSSDGGAAPVSGADMAADTCCPAAATPTKPDLETRPSAKLPEDGAAAHETNRSTLANGRHAPQTTQQDIERADQQRLAHKTTAASQQQQPIQDHLKSVPLLGEQSEQQQFVGGRKRQLTYLQVLLIRRWPYLALAICTMGALIFGILLSALTVFLMHKQSSECVSAASAAARSGRLLAAAGADSSPLLAAREFELPPVGELTLSSHLSAAASENNGFGGAAGASLQSAGAADGSEPRARSSQEAASPQSRFQRLPTSLWPLHYDLFVQPYLYEPFNFTGKVLIRIKCTEATDNITLHALDLDLNASAITLSELPAEDQSQQSAPSRLAAAAAHARPEPKVSGLAQDKQLQHSIIRLDGQLEPGREYLLGIDFVGFLNDDLAGFYKIKYELKNSTTAAPATT